MWSYHESIEVKGKLIDTYEAKAKKQDQLVLEFFKSWPGFCFTPADVWVKAGLQHFPLTSIRRSITNLEKSNWLVKAGKGEGIYGRENYQWKLK